MGGRLSERATPKRLESSDAVQAKELMQAECRALFTHNDQSDAKDTKNNGRQIAQIIPEHSIPISIASGPVAC